MQMDPFVYGILRKSELYMLGIMLWPNQTPFLPLNHIVHLHLNVQMVAALRIHLTKNW